MGRNEQTSQKTQRMIDSQQLGLELGVSRSAEINEDRQKIEWSFSRRSILEQCPRRYYYHYYGANSRTAKTEPLKEHLQSLKILSNRYMRAGEILHIVVRTYLKSLQKGEDWLPEQLCSWAKNIYRSDRAYSRVPANERKLLKFEHPPVPLLEFHYQFRDAEDLYAESETRLLQALENFSTRSCFEHFRLGASKKEAYIEKTIQIKRKNFKARGQIDLAYQDNGRIIIPDWKISGSIGGREDLQLAFYAIWAVEDEYYCPPNEVDAYRVHLSEANISTFPVSYENLLRAKMRIIQDMEKIFFLDEYGKNAISDAFTPCGQPRICTLCSYQGICPKE